MGPSHRYDLIKDSDDIKDESPNKSPSILSPWWKILPYMLLAASFGLGSAFGVVLAFSFLKPSDNTAANAAASTTLSADLTLPTTSAALAADLTVPTTSTSVDQVDDSANSTDGLAGKVLDCGWSPEEAREKGCVFDVMMQDWVPKPCYDPNLTEKYLAKGNYTWYADTEGHILSDEEMRKGEHHMAWMSANYHQAHCVFSWEKLIRALRNNWPISQELLSYDHVLHCHMQTLGGEMRRRDSIGVGAPTNYAKCALYSTWETDFIPDKHSSIEK